MKNSEQPIYPPSTEELSYKINQDIKLIKGLTKREYFAGLAMQGLMSNLIAIRREGFKDSEISEFARMQADALLAQLEKPTK